MLLLNLLIRSVSACLRFSRDCGKIRASENELYVSVRNAELHLLVVVVVVVVTCWGDTPA